MKNIFSRIETHTALSFDTIKKVTFTAAVGACFLPPTTVAQVLPDPVIPPASMIQFTDGQPALADEVNNNFNELQNKLEQTTNALNALITYVDTIQPNQPQPPLNGLVSRFTFDSSIEDSMGTANLAFTAPAGQSATYETGIANQALKINSQQYLTDTNAFWNLQGDDFSISLWVKTLEENVTGAPGILAVESMSLMFGTGNQARWYIYSDPNNQPNFIGGGSIANGAWHHIVITRDYTSSNSNHSDWRLYVNGNLVDSDVNAVDVLAGDTIEIGRSYSLTETSAGDYVGSIDDLLIYKRALNQTDVDILYSMKP